MAEQPTYHFGGGGPRGLWLGLGPGRLMILGAGIAVGVLAMHAGANPVLALLPTAASAGWCLLPAGGASLGSWAGLGVRHAAGVLCGGRRWTRPLCQHQGTLGAPPAEGPRRRLALPPELGRLQLFAHRAGGAELGVLVDTSAARARLTCVLAASGVDAFSLADPTDQQRLLAGWGDALGALAAEFGDRHQITWTQRATAAPARGPGEDLLAGPARPAPGDDYTELLEVVGGHAVHIESYLGLTVLCRGARPSEGAREAAAIWRLAAAQLLGAQILTRPLDAGELAALIASWATSTGRPADPHPGYQPVRPASRREAWDHLRTDDTYHRSYLVAGWPMVPVGPGWLDPLLFCAPPGAARSLTVHLHAIPARKAARRARAARISADLDVEDRARLGFGLDAARRRSQAEAVAIDEELAAGHACHRVAAVLACSAGDLASLADACRVSRAAAAAARCELVPLHGQHAAGWAASLPVGALRHRSAP
ncbi:MAG: SCO6880 family protein [Mycobacteriales bacterium]